MSVIPKINVSRPTKRNKISIPSDTSTSANFGEIQPVFCRELAKDVDIKVKVDSLVRLASMPLPTFGRIDLRHYHSFVPISSLWEPFGALLSAQHYTTDDGKSYIPSQMPRVNLKQVWTAIIRQYSYISICSNSNVLQPLEDVVEMDEAISSLLHSPSFFGNSFTNEPNLNLLCFGNHLSAVGPLPQTGGFVCTSTDGTYKCVTQFNYQNIPSRFHWEPLNTNVSEDSQASPAAVNALSADFVETTSSGYTLCYKLMPFAKHLRKIVIGLGYQFNPFDWTLYDNPYKLFAFYKTWFEFFRPTREFTWVDTECYKLLKRMQQPDCAADVSFVYPALTQTLVYWEQFWNFILRLMCDTYYYLPSDYFTMATLSPMQGNSDIGSSISSPVNSTDDLSVVHGTADHGELVIQPPQGSQYPLIQKMAQRLLTFTNKNTVIGRGIREYLLTHYGLSDDSATDNTGVIRIGVSDVQIKMRDVLSTAESEQGYLGEYGGFGLGAGESETFDYHAKEFGYFITSSVIIPRSGYYQGTLKENFHAQRFDFFVPEFDALGYQILERRELMDSYVASVASAAPDSGQVAWNPSTEYGASVGYGFVPRYSEYKVGRNIVNGDLSIAGMPSMRPYFFDRRFPESAFALFKNTGAGLLVSKPHFVPSTVFDAMRRIDPTDTLGQYNRIFNVSSNWLDHFTIHLEMNVDLIAPYKSLSDSFDTLQSGEDVVQVNHS